VTRAADEVAPSRAVVLRAALDNGAVRRALVAYLLFNLAEWAAYISLLVWAYDRGGVTASSAMALIQLVPASLLAASVSALVERLGPGRALTVGYALQAVGLALTGAAIMLGAPFGVAAVAAAVTSVAVTLTRPAHNTVLPALARTTGELTAANSASGTVEALAAVAGPLMAAVLIGAWGAGGVLVALAAGQLAAAALTSGMPVRRTPRVSKGPNPRIRLVLRDRTARTLAVLTAAEYTLIGMLDILLVALALDALDLRASGPGLLNAAVGVGGVLGAGLSVLLVGRARLAPALLVGAVAAGVAFALTGASERVVVAVVFLALGGAGKLFVDVASRTLVHRCLPDKLLAAFFGVQETTMMAGLAAGSLLAPILVTAVGLSWSFVVAGVVLPTVCLLCLPALWAADARTHVPEHVFALLRGVPFLAALAPRVVERLAIEARVVAVPAGQAVVSQGGSGDTFYVIEQGTAEVTTSGRRARELGAGDFFGELALLRDIPRTATVVMTSDALLVELDREPFLLAVTGSPQAVDAAEEGARRYTH
jgi:MFS family permease